MEFLAHPGTWIVPLLTLALLEIVLGIGNIIFISILAGRLPKDRQARARQTGLMLVFAGVISDFVNRHPTVKMLALSFLILIGVTLAGESLGQHIPKGYIYFSMAFAFAVEMLNLRLRSRPAKPVELRQSIK